MTDVQNPSSQILRRDNKGRVQTPPEIREQILDEFETSGLSAPKFAELHGIKYPTFASWRKRRREKQSIESKPEKTETAPAFTFLEIEPARSIEPVPQNGGVHLIVELAGGHRVQIADRSQIDLAAGLISQLNLSTRS